MSGRILSNNLVATNGGVVDDTTIRTARGTGDGTTPYHRVSTADTNATSVKASAGTHYGVQAGNVNAAARYLKLYDKATAPTVVGTDVPVQDDPHRAGRHGRRREKQRARAGRSGSPSPTASPSP